MFLFKRLMQTLDRIIKRVGYIALLLSGVLILIMSWLSTYGVGRRYLLHNPEPYSYELSTSFLVGCVMLAIAGVQIYGRHLRVDFVASRFPQSVQAFILDIFIPLLALFYVALITWQGWGIAWYSLIVHETSQSAWREPWWPTKMVIPIGAGLLCLVLLAQLGRGVTSLIQKIRH
jgi:TRAP-type C4-dicarboxylate transport system permease small subunit